jgi:hypothetical protein
LGRFESRSSLKTRIFTILTNRSKTRAHGTFSPSRGGVPASDRVAFVWWYSSRVAKVFSPLCKHLFAILITLLTITLIFFLWDPLSTSTVALIFLILVLINTII